MKSKNFLSTFVGFGALTFALCLNFIYASNDYGIVNSTLTIEVLAQMNSSDNDNDPGSGTGTRKYYEKKDIEKESPIISCDKIHHTVKIEHGYTTTCKGIGNRVCIPGWYVLETKTGKTTDCPGFWCVIDNN